MRTLWGPHPLGADDCWLAHEARRGGRKRDDFQGDAALRVILLPSSCPYGTITGSAPDRVTNWANVAIGIVWLMNRTEPSPRVNWAPPGWNA